jgi:hypothetical protein
MKIAFQKLLMREIDAEHFSQAREIGVVVDLAGLVVPQRLVGFEARGNLLRRAAAVTRPRRHGPLEVDVEHDAAEVEQQSVGGAGGEGRHRGLRSRILNTDTDRYAAAGTR